MRNSLSLTGLTFLTFSTAVSDCVLLFPGIVQEALPTRSPLNASGPDVTKNVAFTISPGAIVLVNIFEGSPVFKTSDFHPLGTAMLSVRLLTGDPVVFVKVTVVFCKDCGENVWSPGGVPVTSARAMLIH